MDDADFGSRLRRIERRVTWIGETLIVVGAAATGIGAFSAVRDDLPHWAAGLLALAIWLMLQIGCRREFLRDR